MKKINDLQSYLTRLRGLMLTLIILCSIGIGNAWGATASGTYVLCTSTNDLKAGAHYIIASGTSGSVYCISNVNNANNRKTVAASVSSSKITVESNSDIMTFTLGGDNTNGWTFSTDNYAGSAGMLAATSSSSNCLGVVASPGDNGKWAITFSSDLAKPVAKGTNSRKYMKYNYNSGTPIFNCYSSSGSESVYIYKLAASCDNKVTISKGSETNGTFKLDKIGEQNTCDELSVTITPSPAEHFHVASVSATDPATTGTAGDAVDKGDGTWTITYSANAKGASTINVTFEENSKASITLSEAGATTTDATTYYVGDSYTLPSSTGTSCGTKVLVGWSTVTVSETDIKPASNFYEKGETVTLEASQTFYAVFATASGGGSSDMEINFEGESSTYSDWTFTNLNSKQTGSITANGGTYYGTTGGNATASVTTKNKIASPTSLTAYVSKQTKNTTSSTWKIRVSSDLSTWTDVTSQSATSMNKGTWVEMTADLTAYSDVYVQVYYSGSTAVRNIDDLTLTIGGGTTYSAYSTSCAECANNVTVNYTAAPTGGTVAVTKGENAVTSGSTVKTCTGGASLVVTVTPSTHYSVSSVTFTPSAGLVAGDLSGTSTPASTTAGVWTYNVTIAEDAAGTLTIAPTFTEDAHVAINWNVNGVNQVIAATEGLTWVYSGGDITALPNEPSVPAGCSGTKVFAGWSTKHSDATEEDAAYYDDLFTVAGPTGITSAQTYYAVFATSSSNPLAGTVLWDEPFTGDANDQPSVPTSGATVYGSASITYNCSETSYCKLYTTQIAAGGAASPELLVPKSSRYESFTATGIPTAGQLELTLTYYSNQNLSVTTGTSGVTVGDASNAGKLYTRTITVASALTTSFNLTFATTTDVNARLDDIHLVVPGSGTMTDYVTLCAPSWTITYDKNTSDPVTNLPSPTSVLQSTGSGTLSATKPTRATYTFGGWATTADGAKVYDAGAAITGVNADKTLYAVWTKTPVEVINLNNHILNKYVGDAAVTLAVTSVIPDGADMSVTWSSSNPSVASVVAATGVVSFSAVGTATITATSTVTGTTTAVCYVTVRNKPTATFYDLIHGTDLSTYNLQNVAGTSIIFPTLSNTEPGAETCEDQHYIFVGWTTSDNNDDPQDRLVTSGALENDVNKTFYAVWADGKEGYSYTQLTSNSFEPAPTKYVIGVNSSGTMYYFNSCDNTGSNNSWGYTTSDPTKNPPIQFTLSGTASELIATSTEAPARYIVPLTTANFKMSTSSQTLTLNEDGTIHNTGDNTGWTLRGNSINLRWYSTGTGNPAYFYKVEAGSAVSYRTSCCADPLAAPSVTATSTAYTVTLTWDAVAGATGYEVSWNNGAWTAATSPVNKTSLTASTTYTYKVRATYNEAVHCGARVASGNVTTDDVYSVTYSGGTGTGSCSPTGSVATVTYEAGETVTLAATDSYNLTSNNFAAWVVKDAENNDVAVSNNQFTMPASNVTVTATWTAVQDKYYDRMHQSTDASHGGIADGNGKYYIVREGCNYTVPSPADDKTGDTDCHTTHFKLLGWIAQSHLKSDGSIKDGEESFIFQGGTIKSATGATYYAIYAIMTE